MFPRPTPTKGICLRVKIDKKPTSCVKLSKFNFNETSKTSPELTIRGSNYPDDDAKITQAWKRLEINAISKAIVMAPDIGPRSIGPNTLESSEPQKCEGSEQEDEKPDLRNAVTSTPVKSMRSDVNATNTAGTLLTETVTEISPSRESSVYCKPLSDEISEVEDLKIVLMNKCEALMKIAAQRKREDFMRAWSELEEKMKENKAALKMELDQKRLLRMKEQIGDAHQLITETKANAQLKSEQLEKSKFDHDKKIADTNEKIRLIEQKRRELEEKHKQKREELKQCINGIYEMQVAYGQKYNQINEMTKKCKDTRLLTDKISGELPKLKGMNELLLKLVDRSKEGKVSLKDLKTAELLVQQITAVSETFCKHTDEINKSFIKAEFEESLKKEKIPKPEKLLSRGVEDCVSNESLKWHIELRRFLADYERKLQPLITNDALKKFRFECQKAVNVPVNAISPLDDIHLEDKLYKLSRLLQGQAVPLGNTLFLATGDPLGVPFCTNLLAKKFVKQGEYTVSSKPEAAFAIAAVIVALWVDFPEFGRLLLAHFHRGCPYLIPAFLPQVEGQSNEDYYKMLGYLYLEDGKVEPHDKFLRRMSGLMRLYAAILVTPLKRSHVLEGKKHPHSMRDGWRWFTATLNLSPRPDICPTLLFDFLEVVGWMFYQTYGTQFTKLLHLLCAEYFPLLEQVTPDGCGGPVVRLKSFLEKILKEGRVPPPAGLLPPTFW